MDTVYFQKQQNDLSLSQDLLDWAKNQLPEKSHPARVQGFLLSRLALQTVLSAELHELELIDHHKLPARPNTFVSLSHTKDAAIVWVRDQKGHGIDIERIDRVLKDSIWERISNSSDDQSLSRIELWCLKEAAFKSLSNSGHIQGPIPFNEIILKNNKEWNWKTVSGQCQTYIEQVHWQVAKAWC